MLTGGLYNLPFDLLKDLEPIILIGSEPLLIVGKKDLPVTDLKGLIDWLKANPGKASVGIAGVGATGHLTGISFQKVTGTTFEFVPYRGNGPAMQDLLGGQIDFMIEPASNFKSLVGAPETSSRSRSPERRGCRRRRTFRPRTKRESRLLRLALVRALGAEGHAQGRRRQAERDHDASVVRSAGAAALCRTWHPDVAHRPAIAGSLARLPEGRGRALVADHQGGEHQGGVGPRGFGVVIASEAKQSISPLAEAWIASSLALLAMTDAVSSGGHAFAHPTKLRNLLQLLQAPARAHLRRNQMPDSSSVHRPSRRVEK